MVTAALAQDVTRKAVAAGAVAVLAAALAVVLAVVASGPTPLAAGHCTTIVTPAQREVTSAAPGDVLCLEHGTRGALRLFGLAGTADRPITVVNLGGVVVIDATGSYAGIEIRDSSHLHITGTGVEARCGARYEEPEQACGIRISGSSDGITGKVRTEHLTVDHVEIGHIANTGVGVKDKQLSRYTWTQHDVAFRDLYIHDLPNGEGHYHGSSSYRDGSEILLDGVEITRNLVVRTGRDGIQVGSAPWNCVIQDNVVYDTGLSGELSHRFGIVVNRGASCDIVGNRVSRTAGEAIYDQGLHGQTIAGNLIEHASGEGIDIRQGDQSATNPETPDWPRSTHVVGNTIRHVDGDGIRLGNSDGQDNRITGNVFSGVTGRNVVLDRGVTALVRT
jgi:hypothetical protein